MFSLLVRQHWTEKFWSKRSNWKIVLPPTLHIKLGLMKQFVKARKGECFKLIRNNFSKLSNAQVKEGIFVGSDI